ncbi:hypothetical protein [Actinomadura geliboluensis]|uniref:hypothetical protein n=1 Tax=Actinomadura geliboluensis TaxID=882440 RepID=UPI003690B1C7
METQVPVDLGKAADTDTEPPPAEEPDGDALEGVVVRPDLPALLPDWMRDWEIAKARADVRARRAAYKAAFHLLRTPQYSWRFAWGGVVGWYRGGLALVDWLTLGESRELRRDAAAKRDADTYLALLRERNDHVRIRGIIAGGTAAAVASGVAVEALLLPHPLLWAEGALAWAVAAWYGGPEDEPGLLDDPDVPVQLDLSAEHLNAAFRAIGILKGKDGDDDAPRLVLVQPPMRDSSRSWSAVVDLPRGTGKSANDVLNRRDRLAAELGVDEIQLDVRRVRAVHRGHAGRLSIWMCDEDPYLQDKPTPSPLVKADSFDVWDPIPFGRDARGDRVDLPVMWQSMFWGGLPRRGKTSAQRDIVAAGVLDASVRHRVADGKGGADWKPMRRLAYRYVLGAEADAVRALEDMLDEAIADMEAAFKKLSALPLHLVPDGKLTPQVVQRYGFDLNWITIDELQEYLSAITDNKRREALIDRLCRLARRGPAAGFFCNFASQRPDAASVPTRLREIVTYRYCTQVIDKTSSDMVLGDGKAKQGADASILSEEHVGVGVLVTGPASFTTVLADYITLPEFVDICERGRDLRVQAGALAGDATDDTLSGEREDVIPQVLADALTVMRHTNRIHTTTMLNQLVNLDEDLYGNWTPERLAEELAAARVERSTVQVKIDGVNRNGWHKADLIAAGDLYGGGA